MFLAIYFSVKTQTQKQTGKGISENLLRRSFVENVKIEKE